MTHKCDYCQEQCDCEYMRKLKAAHAFLVDHLEEVHNQIGGVIGYRLRLKMDETEKLWRMLE